MRSACVKAIVYSDNRSLVYLRDGMPELLSDVNFSYASRMSCDSLSVKTWSRVKYVSRDHVARRVFSRDHMARESSERVVMLRVALQLCTRL